MPAFRRHQRADSSGSSQVENGTGRLPCLRRLKRSSSAAATTSPSTTSAAAGSWNTAFSPSTRTAGALPRLGVRPTGQERVVGGEAAVGVVMATRDRAGEVLATLRRLDTLPERPPVAVVDNASSDGTAA